MFKKIALLVLTSVFVLQTSLFAGIQIKPFDKIGAKKSSDITIPASAGDGLFYNGTNWEAHKSSDVLAAETDPVYSAWISGPPNVSTFTNDVPYLTGNETITLSGDVGGSGATAITTTVANDSHDHTNATISHLNGTDFDSSSGVLTGSIGASFDGGGAAVTAGTVRYVQCPYSGTITGYSMFLGASSNAVIDVWKDTYGNALPTVADTICGAGASKPTITGATKSTDTVLPGWTTTVTSGDVLGFNVDSATATTILVQLKIRKGA